MQTIRLESEQLKEAVNLYLAKHNPDVRASLDFPVPAWTIPVESVAPQLSSDKWQTRDKVEINSAGIYLARINNSVYALNGIDVIKTKQISHIIEVEPYGVDAVCSLAKPRGGMPEKLSPKAWVSVTAESEKSWHTGEAECFEWSKITHFMVTMGPNNGWYPVCTTMQELSAGFYVLVTDTGLKFINAAELTIRQWNDLGVVFYKKFEF